MNNINNNNNNTNTNMNDIRVCRHIEYDVSYKVDYVNERVTDVEIKNMIQEKFHIRTIDDYIRIYVEFVKEKVIRTLKNLNAVVFRTFIIDKNKINHRILISLYNITRELLRMRKENIDTIIFVEVLYYNESVYRGDISFENWI